MILCVCLNPSIDTFIHLEQFHTAVEKVKASCYLETIISTVGCGEQVVPTACDQNWECFMNRMYTSCCGKRK